ncbi:MAG: fumarylacetoacetate hydrolase family protein [Thermomicrobiales bacterium]|nr:fumarylacetoacetate hydrolase family protein [Thermomicrobiales bacterium]
MTGITIAGDIYGYRGRRRADRCGRRCHPRRRHPDSANTAIFLLAGNYQSHIIEGGGSAVDKEKINPRPFIKPSTAIIGTGDPILIPPDSRPGLRSRCQRSSAARTSYFG